jgi:hypothetical protein
MAFENAGHPPGAIHQPGEKNRLYRRLSLISFGSVAI